MTSTAKYGGNLGTKIKNPVPQSSFVIQQIIQLQTKQQAPKEFKVGDTIQLTFHSISVEGKCMNATITRSAFSGIL